MSIYSGGKKIASIFKGGKAVDTIYKGGEVIYSSFTPPPATHDRWKVTAITGRARIYTDIANIDITYTVYSATSGGEVVTSTGTTNANGYLAIAVTGKGKYYVVYSNGTTDEIVHFELPQMRYITINDNKHIVIQDVYMLEGIGYDQTHVAEAFTENDLTIKKYNRLILQMNSFYTLDGDIDCSPTYTDTRPRVEGGFENGFYAIGYAKVISLTNVFNGNGYSLNNLKLAAVPFTAGTNYYTALINMGSVENLGINIHSFDQSIEGNVYYSVCLNDGNGYKLTNCYFNFDNVSLENQAAFYGTSLSSSGTITIKNCKFTGKLILNNITYVYLLGETKMDIYTSFVDLDIDITQTNKVYTAKSILGNGSIFKVNYTCPDNTVDSIFAYAGTISDSLLPTNVYFTDTSSITINGVDKPIADNYVENDNTTAGYTIGTVTQAELLTPEFYNTTLGWLSDSIFTQGNNWIAPDGIYEPKLLTNINTKDGTTKEITTQIDVEI